VQELLEILMLKAKWLFVLLPLLLVAGAGAFFLAPKDAAGKPVVTVYKSPTCGCCGKWEEHLKASGFEVDPRPTDAMNAVKAEHGVPGDLQSCHTAIVDGYVIEGHVPASSIKKLLAEKPAGVKGLSVPGMPIGSPGMEGPNPENYDVVTFKASGETEVFEKF
jgi:hypothetical protein